MDDLHTRNRSATSRLMIILLLLLPLLSLAAPGIAQEGAFAPAASSSTPGSQQGPTDPAEMEAFLDELLGRQLESRHIAGAAVAVVKDGELFFAKGYGYADLEKGIPVDAEQTLFRIGSVTKLFTWTAVMQLAEQRMLDLDEDVNTYLDFRIEDTYPQPVTLKHLLAHTAGFEDRHVNMVTLAEESIAPEREWLVSHVPARVRPPGDVVAYSNFGAALAGYIVARVSGHSYSRYVQEHILRPLGMNRTTVEWPTPPELQADESVGYAFRDGAFQVFPRLCGPVDLFPAGAMRAPATDMARFMIAHLGGGLYSDPDIPAARILEQATALQMHSTLYTPDPRMLGVAHGFFEFSANGRHIIGHGGGAEPMQSTLLLFPEQHLGVFVTYNSEGGGALARQHFGFQREFVDHYYPAPPVEPIPLSAEFAQRADQFVGAFRWTRSSDTTLEKYTSQLLGPTIHVKNPGDGTLLLATPYGEMRFAEVEPLFFRQVDSRLQIVFHRGGDGRIVRLSTDVTPMFAFERVPWYEGLGFNMALLAVCGAMFVSAPSAALLRSVLKRRGGGRQPRAGGAGTTRGIVLGICILNLMFVAGNIVWGQQIVFGVPYGYKVVLGLGVVAAMLTLGAVAGTVAAWKGAYWNLVARLHYSAVTAAAVAFVWFLNHWNLLGWRY